VPASFRRVGHAGHPPMLNDQELADRRFLIAASPGLQQLLVRLDTRALPLLDRRPVIPAVKALLSVDGGVCPADGTPLEFDPWSPDDHRCPKCDLTHGGERQHRWWGPPAAPLARRAHRPSRRPGHPGRQCARGRRVAQAPRRVRQPLPRLPEPEQRARAFATLLLHLSRVDLDHQYHGGGTPPPFRRPARPGDVGCGGPHRE
jgi:hypothetical protein